MIANVKETINLLDQLRESDRKLTEALLEIAHPNKIDAFENPYDVNMVAECSQEPGTTDIGELRRRLYVAERHGFVKLAAMWRRQIEKALGGNFRPPGRKRIMKIAFEPMLRQLQRKLTRNIAAGRFEMTKPLEAVKRGREFGAGKRLIENRALSNFRNLSR